MKSSNHQFFNHNLFHLRFLFCTKLTLTILGITVNYSVADGDIADADIADANIADVNIADLDNDYPINLTPVPHHNTTVSTYTISYIYFQPAEYSHEHLSEDLCKRV